MYDKQHRALRGGRNVLDLGRPLFDKGLPDRERLP